MKSLSTAHPGSVGGMDREAWDRRYEEKDLVWSAEPNQFLPPAVRGLEPGRALDLAAGEGRNAIWLAQQGWEVTAVDFSGVAIGKGRQIAEARGIDVEWLVSDVLAYEPEPDFNLVLIFYVHFLEPEMERLFGVARKALRPGGRLIALGHHLKNLDGGYGGPQFPQVLWTEERITPLIAGMEIVKFGERLRPVVAKPGEVIPAGTTAIDLWVDAIA